MTAMIEGQPVRNAPTTEATPTMPVIRLTACRPWMTWVKVISDGRGSVAGMTVLISASRLAKGALEAGEPAHHGLALHRERDADVPRHAEARARHREHTLLGQPG